MYNELYNKVKEEVVNLDKFLEKISSNCKKAQESYREACVDSSNKSEVVDSLRKQEKQMLSKNGWIADTVRHIIIVGTAVILASLVVITLFSNIFNPILKLILSGVELYAGFSSILGITAWFEYKVREKIKNKIRNTEEYIELSKKIEEAEKELGLSRAKVDRKNKILKWQEGIYKQVIKKRDVKRGVLNYFYNEINPKERTGNYSRRLKKLNK